MSDRDSITATLMRVLGLQTKPTDSDEVERAKAWEEASPAMREAVQGMQTELWREQFRGQLPLTMDLNRPPPGHSLGSGMTGWREAYSNMPEVGADDNYGVPRRVETEQMPVISQGESGLDTAFPRPQRNFEFEHGYFDPPSDTFDRRQKPVRFLR